jgi:hypothetical protein
MTAATNQQFPVTLEDHLTELAEARARLLAEIGSDPSETAPALSESGRWSVAETVYHLHLAEAGISRMLEKALRSGERHSRMSDDHLRAEWERIRTLSGNRQMRANAPSSAVPANAPDLAEAIERLHQSRQKLLEILNPTSLDELASISMPHPLEGVGKLTGAGWVSLIAYHELRHTEQIREIKAGLA